MQATKLWILAIMASSIAAHGVAVIADAAVDMPVSMQKETVSIIDEISSLCQAYLQSGIMDDADMQHLHDLVQECILRWDEFSESERNALAAIFDELAQLLEVVDATKSTRDQGNVPVLQLVINQNTERLRDLALRTLVVDNLLVTNSVTLPSGYATPNNVANTLVLRDGTGSFSAQNISAQGMLELPTTTATTGQLRINNSAVLHTYGMENTFVGAGAGNFTLTGTQNIGVGVNALKALTTGNRNVGMGDGAAPQLNVHSDVVAIGYKALNKYAIFGPPYNDVSGSVAIGSGVMKNYTTGYNNIAIGMQAMGNTAGVANNGAHIVIGTQAGESLGAGNNNILLGNGCCQHGLDVYSTIGIGDGAISSISNVLSSVLIGQRVSSSGNTVNTVIGIGDFAFSYANNVRQCIGIGDNVFNGALNTIGSVGIGSNALHFANGANYCTATGYGSLSANTTGSLNTCYGYLSGSAYTTESNNICIGANVTGVAGDSSVCRIGNIRGKTTRGNDAIAVLVDSQNQLGTVSSSARYKTNIQDLDAQRADAILAVRPVTFNYLNKDGQPFDNISMGLIAEEVAAVNPEWVVYDEEGLPMTIRYHELIIPVIKQIHYLAQENKQIKDQYNALLDRISALEGTTVHN